MGLEQEKDLEWREWREDLGIFSTQLVFETFGEIELAQGCIEQRCLKRKKVALAGVVQWIDPHPVDQRVGCQFSSWSGHMSGLRARTPVTEQCFSHTSMFLSLSFSSL